MAWEIGPRHSHATHVRLRLNQGLPSKGLGTCKALPRYEAPFYQNSRGRAGWKINSNRRELQGPGLIVGRQARIEPKDHPPLLRTGPTEWLEAYFPSHVSNSGIFMPNHRIYISEPLVPRINSRISDMISALMHVVLTVRLQCVSNVSDTILGREAGPNCCLVYPRALAGW